MMGISPAPIAEKLIVQIIAGEQPEIDTPQFDPDGYPGPAVSNFTAN
jgi:hypothetical protein